MSVEQQNVAALKSAYEMWDSNKEQAFAHWMALFADNVQFASLANGAPGMEFSCAGCNKNDIQKYFERLAKDWEMISFETYQFIAEGDNVVMRGRCSWRNRKTKKVVETPKADFFVMKNGQIVNFFEFYDTAAAIAAAH